VTDFFIWLQKLSQEEGSEVEVFVDEDGEVEFEVDADVFVNILKKYSDEIDDEQQG